MRPFQRKRLSGQLRRSIFRIFREEVAELDQEARRQKARAVTYQGFMVDSVPLLGLGRRPAAHQAGSASTDAAATAR